MNKRNLPVESPLMMASPELLKEIRGYQRLEQQKRIAALAFIIVVGIVLLLNN